MTDERATMQVEEDETVKSAAAVSEEQKTPEDDEGFSRFLAKTCLRNLTKLGAGRNISDAAITNMFNQAKTDFSAKIVPNLKRARAAGEQQDDNSSHGDDSDWIEPKRFVKNPSSSFINAGQPKTGNRFTPLINAPQNVAFEHPARQQVPRQRIGGSSMQAAPSVAQR